MHPLNKKGYYLKGTRNKKNLEIKFNFTVEIKNWTERLEDKVEGGKKSENERKENWNSKMEHPTSK